MCADHYIHGTTPTEQQRLARLNRITNPAFLAFLELPANAQVLEIGSGLGILAAEIAQSRPDVQLTGVEYAQAQLAAAPHDQPRLTFAQGDGRQLPLADDTFDVVYCRYLLEHVTGPELVLNEARRVLKPGGKLFLQENDILVSTFEPECPAFDQVWKQFVVLQARLGGDARIGRRLFQLVQQAGFVDIALSVAPEVHWSGSEFFAPWVENLAGNIRGAAESLIAAGLATHAQISAAIAELAQLQARPDATSHFYWHRARGSKPRSTRPTE